MTAELTKTQPTENQARINSALNRYRALAWITGVWLIFLCAEIVAKYGFGNEDFSWVGIVHGWVYLVFLIFTIDLAIKVRWSWQKTLGTALSGTIPALSFIIEHKRTAEVRKTFLAS